MKGIVFATAAVFLAGVSLAFGDASTEQVQRALKDQGFYYGEITGQTDTDTTAAIRRFQIRNGLKVTGELDAETRKSLGVSAATSAPKSTPAPSAAPRAAISPDTSDPREERRTVQPDETEAAPPAGPRVAPYPGYAPDANTIQPETAGVFDGTPFEAAPPEIQQRVVLGAQTLLARAGYYQSGIDGVFGPGTAAALRAYQARIGIQPTGRLDMETLGALGLLPGQNRPGFAPHRRFMRPPPAEFTPDGEPIYTPR
jgi:peptidoglycan hydrolase-like protein with peptidoglycan-binding domain